MNRTERRRSHSMYNRRMRGAIALLLVGCSYNPQGASIDATGDSIRDAPPVVVDAPPGSVCVGANAFELCIAPTVTDPKTLSGTLDTDNSSDCIDPSLAGFTTTGLHPLTCIVAGSVITVNGLVVVGTKPLALASTTAITINGVLDIAAHGNTEGAGARSQCNQGNSPGNDAGGAGAALQEAGGNGGDGPNSNPGGVSGQLVVPSVLRGGCDGQDGNGSGGDNGRGGGALFVAAKTNITISSATINASGSRGEGGGQGSAGVAPTPDDPEPGGGGGGGGSGGFIYLHAGIGISASSAKIVANGGGGGGGGSDQNSGSSGRDPNPNDPLAAPGGGDGPGSGGNGGPGFPAANRSGQNSTSSTQGGGGGGGGSGFLLANFPLIGAITSPTRSP